jgi:hypothetical protein
MSSIDKRIQDILGDERERTMQNAERYCDYLLKHLSFPIEVIGREDFPWEEPYVLGVWDKIEYEELKKSKPSHTDTFVLLGLEPPNGHEDVTAKVQRITDKKHFDIGLSWLCCKDDKNEASGLLEDFGSWHTNY